MTYVAWDLREIIAVLGFWFLFSVPFGIMMGTIMRRTDEIERAYRYGRNSSDDTTAPAYSGGVDMSAADRSFPRRG